MTTYTKHLEDRERDMFAACGLIVIDGEPCPACGGDGGYIVHDDQGDECRHGRCRTCGVGIEGNGRVAPEGWCILTEPCDTCKDMPWGWRYENGGHLRCDNPDCVGGRRVVTLTATCLDCRAGMAHLAWHCDETSVVTLGRFIIPVLMPVYDADMVPTAEMVKTDAVYVSQRLDTCWIDSDFENELPLDDPLPRPGQFIARPEIITITDNKEES